MNFVLILQDTDIPDERIKRVVDGDLVGGGSRIARY